jgi:hypothetical protein
MVKISLEVSPEVVKKIGIEALQARLQRTIELEELSLIAGKMEEQLKASGIDYNAITEKARQEAWEEMKATYLKDIAE